MGISIGENLASLSDTQRGFTLCFGAVQESDEAGDELGQTIPDMFAPTVLFSEDHMPLQAAHDQLQDYLERHHLQHHLQQNIAASCKLLVVLYDPH